MTASYNIRNEGPSWPKVDVADWAGTKRSLHAYAQMVGKIRLAASPLQPNWMFTALYLTPRGLTTGAIPWRDTSFDATIDFFESSIVLRRSDGARTSVPLVPARTVAEIYADLSKALRGLGVDVKITTIPQEVPDTTPFDEDRRPSEYDPAAALRWFTLSTTVTGLFDVWRTPFFGRTGIQVWWGALDVAVMLFSGRKVTPPMDRGYLMKYDLDAELMNVGLYFGDAQNPPFFYGYIYPQPAGAESIAISPADAAWSTQLSEWVLPYKAVRESTDPHATLRTFLDSIYEQCFSAAGWPRDEFVYDLPPVAVRARRRRLSLG